MTDYKEVLKVALDSDPFRLLIIYLMLCGGFMIFSIVGLLKSAFSSLSTKMNVWTKSLHDEMAETRTALIDHQDRVDSVVKDFTRNISNLKIELTEELDKLKVQADKIDGQIRAYSASLGETQAQVSKRLTLVDELKSDLEVQKGKIIRIDQNFANVRDISKLYEILKKHNLDIQELKKKS